ncbi:EI24 domain-containing protein [Sedimentitalea sp. JM2-8]|uniref:EI24 domain-containing protein n=1 Tax=Sedimentitalea xiamensis TaxID=3050037 RepID=A0ABT7FB11_9RHOB|nr:EI24 domain-containing protein [Sedimentitalea xiamensis]MDK3072307.1 EI24 domain-containing protein [Sedimentitalea xiamensis]
MIFSSVSLALGQLGDPRFRRVLLLGIALTLGMLIAATAAVMMLIGWVVGDDVTLPLIGPVTWLNDLLSWTSVGVMLVLSVFLMVPVASAITSLFLDEVAQAVEDRHYPGLPPVPGVPFADAVRDTVSFLGVLIVANILALILYVMFAPLAPFIFWALNGFLLGREYFTLAAIRRVGRTEAKRLRSRNSGTIWLAGTVMAIPLSVPLVNLFVPVLGAATFTHIFHRLEDRS